MTLNRLKELFPRIWRYRSNLMVNVACNALNTVLSLFTFLSIVPFLRILFASGSAPLESDILAADATAVKVGLEKWSALFDGFVQDVGAEVALVWICAFMVAVTLIKNAVGYLALFSLATIRTGVSRDLRQELYQKVLTLPVGWFTESRKGDIISRMTNDLMEVEFSIIGTIEVMFKAPLTILFSLATLFYLSWELTLFSILFLPLSGFLIGRVAKTLKNAARRGKEQLADLIAVIEETLSGIRIVKAFNAEGQFGNRFKEVNDGYFRLMRRLYKREYLASPISETVSLSVMAILLWFGGGLVLRGEGGLSGDWFIGYLVVFSQIIPPARAISDGWFRIQKGGASMDRLDAILREESHIVERADAQECWPLRTGIQLENVSFDYGGAPVISGLNLHIAKGETVAIVGPSGSGKTTLAHLLARFHDPTVGHILYDGEDIRHFSIQSFRHQLGMVTQDAVLFNDTISANIALGSPDAALPSESRIREVAAAAHVVEFVQKMEHSYATRIGDGGGKLSGGQRQRLSIARALYKDPPILLLDEATSALDTESEQWVQSAINRLMLGRTAVVIAHRLSTIRHASRIVVLDEGQIAEEGTHDELMQREGLYKKLVDMQDLNGQTSL